MAAPVFFLSPVRSNAMPAPQQPDAVTRLRNARALVDQAVRAAAKAEAEFSAAKSALSAAVADVAVVVPVAAKSHDEIVAALDAKIEEIDRDVAACLVAVNNAVNNYTAARERP